MNNSYHEMPHRSKRSSEYISNSLKTAWKNQTIGVIHTPNKALNAWRTPLKPKTSLHLPKQVISNHVSDDKSVTTHATISVDSDEFFKMQEQMEEMKNKIKALETNVNAVAVNTRTINAKQVDDRKSITKIAKHVKTIDKDVEETNSRITDVGDATVQLQQIQCQTDIQIKAMDQRQTILENKQVNFGKQMDAGFLDIKNTLMMIFQPMPELSPPAEEIPIQSKRGSESVSDMTSSQGTPRKKLAITPPRKSQNKRKSPTSGTYIQESTSDIKDDDPDTKL